LYRIIEPTDTDDFEHFLDPPFSPAAIVRVATERPARTMQTVAVNCSLLNASGSN
jgi:hypothetical protein